jgi:hypothetical protein
MKSTPAAFRTFITSDFPKLLSDRTICSLNPVNQKELSLRIPLAFGRIGKISKHFHRNIFKTHLSISRELPNKYIEKLQAVLHKILI